MCAMTGLSDPIKIKGVILKNRIVMPPMNTELATEKGAVTNRLIEHYAKRSKHVGLVIIEHSYISQEGKLSKKQLGIHNDKLVRGLRKLAETVHEAGTPVIIQINHAGGRCTADITGTQPVAPSPTENARELEVEEIEVLAETFATAAKRAINAGFDGVEIHGAHGFLLNQFFSPLTNKRSDKYGGSLERRIRFPLEVVERVKKKVGGKLLLYRLGSDDLDPAGTKVKDSRKFAIKLQKAGVDVIDVSGGTSGSRPEQFQGKQGYFIPQAQEIKAVVQVPVIGVGGITNAEYADSLVRDGKVDLVAIGRELIRNPNWASEAIKTLK
jgi:2,4-dienoyl-CoA reductase-like NADH-dependent reductase (Old Yellow Enzyme family)